MLVAAALLPPTALLVPGVAGRADPLAAERSAALAATACVLAAAPDALVVVVPGTLRAEGRLRPVFTAAGVPDVRPHTAGDVDDVPAAVGLWLALEAGWAGSVRALGAVDPGAVAAELGGPERVGALLVGGGSVRRGPDAPLPEDARAESADDALVRWVRSLDPSQAPDRSLAAELGMSAVEPVAALAALGAPLRCTAVAATLPLGATYVVATWEAA
ncbi:hypothetical protein Q6348_09325 [Isoptericola sp. b441]|uniref:Extradiol ring-cleavage dioxygenase class III enzyme subunit B domain-containing protein n=1 Tax=Actinotalea lenta TaxID=3064654 RepID=A0ABT9D9Z6_9CELL|nr:hypothetical protein [Isoptericola sp. b441]MDO8107395.1 hypothetical protein [Isoptericola sp. b441]